jgi:hypothetical protein
MRDQCPAKLRLGRGREKYADSPIHQFSSTDAPPLPSPHIRGNRMQRSGGATPGAVRALCDRMGSQGTPLPGGLPPLRTAIGAGKDTPHQPDHQSFFIDRGSCPTVRPYPRQSYAGVRGWQPPSRGGLRCSGVCLSLLPGLMPNLTEHKNRITTKKAARISTAGKLQEKKGD